jgi:hypothetical protein
VNTSVGFDQPHKWRRQESRIVRPFQDAADYFSGAGIRFFEGSEFISESPFVIDWGANLSPSPAIKLCLPPVDIGQVVGVPNEQLKLVVVVENMVRQRSEMVFSHPVSDALPDVVLLPETVTTELRTSQGHIRIHLAIILNVQRDSVPGIARRRTSWLARKVFEPVKAANRSRFRLRVENEDFFQNELHLPRNTAYFIEVEGEFDLPEVPSSDLVTVYMSELLHRALVVNTGAASSKAVMKAILADVVASFLLKGFAATEELVSDTALSNVANRIANGCGVSIDDLSRLAVSGQADRIRALVHSQVDLRQAYCDSVGRRSYP